MQHTLTAARKDVHVQHGAPGVVSSWLPVAIGLLIIAIESTAEFSGQNTSSWLRPIFASLFGPITDAHWDAFHHLLRKSGHFVGYGTLGMTWMRAWLRVFTPLLQWTLVQWRIRAASLALFCTFLTASADEFHQTFLPNRTGLFSDVLLDTCGALLFTLIVALQWRRRGGTT
jgi:VanZ family protein